MKNILLICFLLPVFAFSQLPNFDSQSPASPPDYSNGDNWSALPDREDAADDIPKSETWIPDSEKPVDVFYVHPTMYSKGKTWNADTQNKSLNKRVDSRPVRLQASAFNRSGRVYAPRYRQAIVEVFHNKSEDGDKALDLAYSDVKRAFQYYLDHYDQGRPIIIASHSQGTCHSRRLLADFFDNSELQKRLVVAYAVGFGIDESMFKSLKACNSPSQTGCFLTWMTYKDGFEPTGSFYKNTHSINPVTWLRDTSLVDRSLSEGGILLNLSKKYEHAVETRLHKLNSGTILWAKPHIPVFRSVRILHIADINLFWYDIRKNVEVRIQAFNSQ